MTYYSDYDRDTDWWDILGDFGRRLLNDLGHYTIPSDHNPIVAALKDPSWGPEALLRYGNDFNRTSISHIATVCQMVVFDRVGGPEQDRKNKALRRHWYQWYKVDFAQPLSEAFEEDLNDKRWGLNWAGRLSTTYANLVDNYNVTYYDLWVDDASRMMRRVWETLFNKSNILIAVEKDSLFDDFWQAAQALGATCLLSGKGKNSKAATEKALRDIFGWRKHGTLNYDTQEYDKAFTPDNPLYIIHVSDHDYDGHQVIGPTFGEQARRYTPYVQEARIGIKPTQVVDAGYRLEDKMYQVKVSNTGYVEWAEENAIFIHECLGCGEKYLYVGSQTRTTVCCNKPTLNIKVGAKSNTPAFGLEVEAMRVSDYSRLIVQALLSIMPFEHIVERLRIETIADAWYATERVRDEIAKQNPEYQKLIDEIRNLEKIKADFEQEIQNAFYLIAQEHEGDFWEDGDDPTVEQFENHVVRGASGPWRPFSRDRRTELLIEYLLEEQTEAIETLAGQEVDHIEKKLTGILDDLEYNVDEDTLDLFREALRNAELID